jgi:hypothetical protein
MREILKLTFLILFMLFISNSYSQTVNIGIYGTPNGSSIDLRIVLTATGGNYSVNGVGIIFTIKSPSYSSITYSNDSIYSGITLYTNPDRIGNSGAHYRTYFTSTGLIMNLNSGSSVQILRVNALAPAPTTFEIVESDGDGLINIGYYIENYLGDDVHGILSPQSIDAPMPVELINFKSFVNNNNVQLNWSTSKEINNKGFYIERTLKSDILQWSQIGFLEGINGSNINQYSYPDNKLETGKYNYRLKQCDYNGKFQFPKNLKYLKIILIHLTPRRI